MPLQAGTRLGAYEILAAIGAGGMGEVYRARDPRLGREIAIKVLPEDVARDPERLARAAGLPARDVYGLRVAKSEKGLRSLGLSSDNATKAQHCRAEVYLVGYGWVPVDPADVRKVVLEEPPGHLPMDAEPVQRARKRLFGAWEMNWIAYNYAHDVALPGSKGPAINYFMYPQGETANGRLDPFDAEAFKYEITSKEVTPA